MESLLRIEQQEPMRPSAKPNIVEIPSLTQMHALTGSAGESATQ